MTCIASVDICLHSAPPRGEVLALYTAYSITNSEGIQDFAELAKLCAADIDILSEDCKLELKELATAFSEGSNPLQKKQAIDSLSDKTKAQTYRGVLVTSMVQGLSFCRTQRSENTAMALNAHNSSMLAKEMTGRAGTAKGVS